MNKDLAQKLEELKCRDLQKCSQLISENRLYGNYDREMQQVHIDNAIALDKIISEHGWTGISLVGFEGCRTAWLIAQHSICTPDLQRKFLKLIRAAAERGDVPKKQAAMLADRIRFNEGKPQIYGTVLDWDENGVLGCEVEDINKVDILRNEVGLPHLQESITKNQEEVKVEGGKAPEDFIVYRERFLNWAKSVGWQ